MNFALTTISLRHEYQVSVLEVLQVQLSEWKRKFLLLRPEEVQRLLYKLRQQARGSLLFIFEHLIHIFLYQLYVINETF